MLVQCIFHSGHSVLSVRLGYLQYDDYIQWPMPDNTQSRWKLWNLPVSTILFVRKNILPFSLLWFNHSVGCMVGLFGVHHLEVMEMFLSSSYSIYTGCEQAQFVGKSPCVYGQNVLPCVCVYMNCLVKISFQHFS